MNGAGCPTPSAAATLRAAVLPCRIACCEVGGQGRPGRAGSGTAAASPSAHTPSSPCTRRWSSTTMRPRSSSGSPSVLAARMRHDAGGPDDGARRSVSPVEIRARVGGHLLERRAEPDVDAAAAQLAQRVLGELEIDLGQHAVGRLGEHPAHPVQARARIELHRLGGEVLELGERLEAGVAAADEQEGEQLLAQARRPRSRRRARGTGSRGCAARSRPRGS